MLEVGGKEEEEEEWQLFFVFFFQRGRRQQKKREGKVRMEVNDVPSSFRAVRRTRRGEERGGWMLDRGKRHTSTQKEKEKEREKKKSLFGSTSQGKARAYLFFCMFVQEVV